MQFEPLPPVPAVTLARRLRQIPLFRFASVDELFRVSAIAQQVRYEASATVQEKGAHADFIQVLLEGGFEIVNGKGDTARVSPPAMLGFQEVLEGTAIQDQARASEESIALVMPSEEFRTLLSANIELAQGLFRTLLERSAGDGLPSREETTGPAQAPLLTEALTPVEKALYLQTIPIFSRATADELYLLATIAREVSFAANEVFFSEGHPASIVLLLSGTLALEAPRGGGSAEATAGDCLGADETLAASDWSCRATASSPGKALRIDREALFELLGDNIDLLQGIFGAIFFESARDSRRSHNG
jgi:CRP-like cAMP-binding protein